MYECSFHFVEMDRSRARYAESVSTTRTLIDTRGYEYYVVRSIRTNTAEISESTTQNDFTQWFMLTNDGFVMELYLAWHSDSI